MSGRDDRRRFERLAAMQRLARDQRHHELGTSCETTDARAEAEAHSAAAQQAAAAELEATFGAARLCVDRLGWAAREFHFAEAALAEARRSTRRAREAEDGARAGLSDAEHRLELVGGIARALRRKHADRRENAAILQSVAVNLARGERP
jgi:hypothetical protein